MVATYEKLEQDLLFLQSASGSEDTINWSDLSDELDRIIGTITHNFYFGGSNISDSSSSDYVSYSSSYSPEDTSAPTEVMTNIREEIDTYEAAVVGFNYKSTRYYVSYGIYEEDRPWASALGLLNSFYSEAYPFEYGSSAYTLEGLRFSMNHRMYYADGFGFSISIGVGTQDNFNDSGLTVRQTRFQTAQENISTYQAQLISAAVTMDPEMVTLLMQLIAGQSDVSIGTISNYLSSLQQQLDYAENMMYQAALAMAASDYAEDSVYQRVYSDNGYHTASQVIELLRLSAFDENVMAAFDNRMDLLNNQKAMLEYSEGLLRSYQDPNTGAFTTERISAAEAATLLAPVLDMNNMTLYGYIAERPVQSSDSDTLDTPQYVRTVLYAGFGAAPVQIDGNQATVGNSEPVTILGDVYLNLGRSLSGSLLALAKAQVETYTPSTGGVDASDVAQLESGMTRKAYSMVTGGELFTLDLRTEDVPYALPTNLWNYTGNTAYISANNMLVDLYGYCIDLSFRTNATNSDLLLQTEAVNRIDNSDPALVDKSMGAGSYMEFTIDHPSYRITQAKE